jgi:hypothetical protein
MCSDLQHLHIDVMCKWAPWSERAVEALQQYPLPASAQQPQQQQQPPQPQQHQPPQQQQPLQQQQQPLQQQQQPLQQQQQPLQQQQQPLQQQQQQQQRIQELRALMCDPGRWGRVRKALSQAHGTLHSQACQMLWQPGWTSGCAKTLGEEGEQLFSYLSRFSGTTRNQSSAGGLQPLYTLLRVLAA